MRAYNLLMVLFLARAERVFVSRWFFWMQLPRARVTKARGSNFTDRTKSVDKTGQKGERVTCGT